MGPFHVEDELELLERDFGVEAGGTSGVRSVSGESIGRRKDMWE